MVGWTVIVVMEKAWPFGGVEELTLTDAWREAKKKRGRGMVLFCDRSFHMVFNLMLNYFSWFRSGFL